MLELKVSSLRKGDVFTSDDGETWHEVTIVTVTHIVRVYTTEGEQHMFNLGDLVVVK